MRHIGYESYVSLFVTARVPRAVMALWLALAWFFTANVLVAGPARDGLVVMFSGAGVDESVAKRAIAVELGLSVVSEADGRELGTLEVTIAGTDDERTALLRFTSISGKVVSRRIDLPPEDDRAVEAIALLSGNLVRDEAGELIAALAPAPADPNAVQSPLVPEPRPTPEPIAPKPRAKGKAPGVVEAERSGKGETRSTPREHVPLNLSVFPPITLYSNPERLTAGGELGLFYSRIGRVHVGAFNVLALYVDEDLTGFGYGSFFAGAGGKVEGFQLSGLVAYAGAVDGTQLATAVSHVREDVAGAQLAVGASIAGAAIDGAQLGVGLALAGGEVDGAQIAVGAAIAEDVDGFQLGAVTVARDVEGAQVGLVNVGRRIRGTQIGIVNVAEHVEGMPLGLVSIADRVQPTFWASSLVPVNVGVMSRARPGYSMIYGGWVPESDEQQLGACLGVGWPVGVFFFDGDVGYAGSWDGDLFGEVDRHVIRYRVTAGLQASEALAFFLGGGLRHDIEEGPVSTYRGELHAGVQLF